MQNFGARLGCSQRSGCVLIAQVLLLSCCIHTVNLASATTVNSDHLPPTTICLQRPRFRARRASYRKYTVNSDHLCCATGDQVFHAPSAGFSCVEQPCDEPTSTFIPNSPRRKFSGEPRRAETKKVTSVLSFYVRCL